MQVTQVDYYRFIRLGTVPVIVYFYSNGLLLFLSPGGQRATPDKECDDKNILLHDFKA